VFVEMELPLMALESSAYFYGDVIELLSEIMSLPSLRSVGERKVTTR
jgi:hypothetical protein